MCFDNNTDNDNDNNNGSMAEWSNASDSSSDSFGSAGSNPAGTIIGYHTATTMNFELSSTAVLLRGFESRHTYQGCVSKWLKEVFHTMVSDNKQRQSP